MSIGKWKKKRMTPSQYNVGMFGEIANTGRSKGLHVTESMFLKGNRQKRNHWIMDTSLVKDIIVGGVKPLTCISKPGFFQVA